MIMLSFDNSPAFYWLPTYLLCWLVLWLAVKPGVSWRLFIGLAISTFFLLRLPSIVFNAEINPDESQMITQALTLRQDPVYFRSVDGTTGGPLDSYFLILPTLLGLPFDYITAHLTAFFLVSISLWLLFRTANLWFGDKAARLALLAVIFTLGLTQNGDFLHYNSELVALVLLSWSYYLFAIGLAQRTPTLGRMLLTGVLLGMVPFGKLQAVPLAAVVGLSVAVDVSTRQNLSLGARIVRVGTLGIGSLLFPVCAIGLAWLNGVYDDFITFYIQGNLRYASDSNQFESLLHLSAFFQKGSEFDWLVKFTVLVWLTGFIIAIRRGLRFTENSLKIIAFIGLLLLATLYAITRTGSSYVHYLYFLTGPIIFLLAYGWQQFPVNQPSGRWKGVAAMTLFLFLFGVPIGLKIKEGQPINLYPSDQQEGWAIQQTPVAEAIRTYAKPGEQLVVWGWRCDYYVQTQMPQGVAENHTIRSAFAHPMQKDYQKRYLRDFERSQPPVFVDAVGSQNLWMTDRKTQGHEIIQPLGQFIAKHYTYMGLVNDARIYVRNDRLKKVKG